MEDLSVVGLARGTAREQRSVLSQPLKESLFVPPQLMCHQKSN